MAWLLIRAFSDARPSSWKLGDVVEVRPDGCAWGTQEGLPKFYRVQITDVSVETIKARLEQIDEVHVVLLDGEPGKVLRRVRKYQVRIASLPAAIRNELQTLGTVTVTRGQIANYIRDNDGNLGSLD